MKQLKFNPMIKEKTNLMFENLGFFLDIETNEEQIVYCKDILDKSTLGYIGSETITIDLVTHNIYYDNVYNTREVNKVVERLEKDLGWY